MTLEEFKRELGAAMAPLGIHVTHILASADAPCPVLCWQELGLRHVWGDDAIVATEVVGQLDLFTEDEYDQSHKAVTEFLNTVDCTFTYENTSYDPERGEWRYIWTFRLFGG